MSSNDYWKETLAIAAEEAGIALTDEQLDCLAGAAEGAHENYGMAFYSPPASDRISDIEDQWKKRLKEAEAETERIRQDFLKNICRRNNCDPSDVTLEGDGHATIRR